MVHIRLFRQFFTFLFLLILALSLSRSTNAAHLTEPIQILPNVPTFSQPFVVVERDRDRARKLWVHWAEFGLAR